MRSMSRRTWLTAVAAAPLGTWVLASGDAWAQSTVVSDYGAGTLPAGIRSRIVTGVNGIAMHVLEAGFETPARPGMLLVHGFPEPGYSWRKVMLPIAAAGFHVMAPDQRGYGGTDVRFDDDLAPFSVARAGICGKAENLSRRRGPESDSRGSVTPRPCEC